MASLRRRKNSQSEPATRVKEGGRKTQQNKKNNNNNNNKEVCVCVGGGNVIADFYLFFVCFCSTRLFCHSTQTLGVKGEVEGEVYSGTPQESLLPGSLQPADSAPFLGPNPAVACGFPCDLCCSSVCAAL